MRSTIPPPPASLRKHPLSLEPDPCIPEPLRRVIIAARTFLAHASRPFLAQTVLVASVHAGMFRIVSHPASYVVEGMQEPELRQQLVEAVDSLASEDEIVLMPISGEDCWFSVVVLPRLNAQGGAA